MRESTLTLAGMLFLTGCVTFAGDNLKDISPTPGPVRPAIEQTVGDFRFEIDGGKLVTSNKMGRGVNDWILGRWERDGLIRSHAYVEASNFTDASDYHVTLSGSQLGDSSVALQFLSGLTLTIIPYSVNTRFDLKYTLANASTGCEHEATASDSFSQVVGLILLPVALFGQGGREITLDRIADNLYAQFVSAGAFSDHERCATDPDASNPETAEPTSRQKLQELEAMRSRGELSESEFNQRRNELLDSL